MISTQIIVLAKKPYRENALLLSGLSPDFGRLNLVANSAMKLSEKKFPIADLFRELEVEFNEDNANDLFTARQMELATAFDALANNPKHFQLAGRIGSFLLKNAVPAVPQPLTYDALRGVLSQLSAPEDTLGRWTMEQCAVVIRTTYLYESGLLPTPKSEKESDFLENLVAAGVENSPLPICKATYWRTLNNWLLALCEFHRLQK
ncbi:MAG: recombination protein O N-terminal domain-containing protein [Victivallales bacterium]|jgi:hypothetical protein|nr:recombination protein O N-terminal domain-containing protein [Victivallales bacterium]